MGKWGGRAGPLSGVDAQRAMLDEMMGMNRNLDNPYAEIADYRDEVRLLVALAHPFLNLFLALGLGRPASLDSATYLPVLLPLSISHPALPPYSASASSFSSVAVLMTSLARPKLTSGNVSASTTKVSKRNLKPTSRRKRRNGREGGREGPWQRRGRGTRETWK